MIVFTTASGSVYEVDAANKRIRRLGGLSAPTDRVGDGWKAYENITSITIGRSVLIEWTASTPLLPGSEEPSVPGTLTSSVCAISHNTPRN
jgi:hypothetical protein